MIEKFPPRKDEHNLKDIAKLLSEVKRDLKVVEAKHPYHSFLSSALELSLRKVSIALNRLCAESFIDGKYISEIMSFLKEDDPSISSFTIHITKKDVYDTTFPPYVYRITGN